MPDTADTWWGLAIGGAIVGIPLFLFAGPMSRWNRRVSRKGWWHVPPEPEAGSTWWGEKYMRTVGACALVAAMACAVVALTR